MSRLATELGHPGRPVAGTRCCYAVGAAVIGGTSLFGGKGRVLDAVLGGLVIAIIDNGLALHQPAGRRQSTSSPALVLLLAASVDALAPAAGRGHRAGS